MIRLLMMVCLLAFGLVLGYESELANKARERMLLRSLIEVLDRRNVISDSDKTELKNNYNAVRSDDAAENSWCTAIYSGKNVVPGPCGSSYEEFLGVLEDDIRLYAYVRFETGESRTMRCAFITWIGPSVSLLKKVKVSTDKAFVKEQWEHFTKEILSDDKAELLNKSKIETILERKSTTGHNGQ